MNRIDQLFQQKQKDILSIYITAGYPNLHDTTRTVAELATAGVDLIEIGMPYSDPLADGPVIQQVSEQAIANGMTVDLLFEQILVVRKTCNIPIVYMGYLNQVMQYGEERFFNRCMEVGIDGLILPDLPPTYYKQHYQTIVKANGLRMSFLVTPTTSRARRKKIEEASTGFVYAVADANITGATGGFSSAQLSYFRSLQEIEQPTLIGFGISDHNTFTTACEHANGAIIGSAFLKHLGNSGNVFDFVSDITKTSLPLNISNNHSSEYVIGS